MNWVNHCQSQENSRACLWKEENEIPVVSLYCGNSDIVITYDTLFSDLHIDMTGRNRKSIGRIAASAHKVRCLVQAHVSEIDTILSAPFPDFDS